MAMARDAAVKKQKGDNKLFRFFRELRSELKKVVWPTKDQVWNNTLVVLGFMAVAGVIIWSIDAVLTFIVNVIFQTS